MVKSILQDDKECYLCRKYFDTCNDVGLHLHHIYGGWGNRRISDRENFVIYLCPYHHNCSHNGVHFRHDVDLMIKQECQRKFEETHSREEFMALIGRNYLDDEEGTREED